MSEIRFYVDDAEIVSALKVINAKVDAIMASQAELAADLNALQVQVMKIGQETALLLQKITDLEAAIAAGGPTTPEVDAALAALKTQVAVVDDLVPDVVP